MKGVAIAFAGLIGMLAPPNPSQNNDIVSFLFQSPRSAREFSMQVPLFSSIEQRVESLATETCYIKRTMSQAGYFCIDNERRVVTTVSEGSIKEGRVKWKPQGTPLEYMADLRIGSQY